MPRHLVKPTVPAGLLLLALFVLLLNPPVAKGEAVIEGTVTIPERKPIPPRRGRYSVGTQAGPADPIVAIVYLEGPGIGASAGGVGQAGGTEPRAKQQMAQQHLQFAPGVLAVQAGTEVEFPNLDDEYHNVFSYSKAHRFDFGRYRKEEAPPKLIFAEPGVVKLYCEVHDHMRGWILVVDTPYFAKSDAKGKFKLTVPSIKEGDYTLKAWVPEGATRSKDVHLKDGAALTVSFEEM